MKKYYLLFLLILFSKYLTAQEMFSLPITKVPFLTLQQSPLLQGAGQIGAAIPMQDAIGFYYNPAQLGYFARTNSLSCFFMPERNKWMPGIFPDISYQTTSLTIGLNNNDNNSPLSIGLGYVNSKMHYGKFTPNYISDPITLGKYDSDDSYECYSFGVGYNYYLLFNLGFSIKSYHSYIHRSFEEYGFAAAKINSTALDFGALIIAPISKLFFKNAYFNLSDEASIKPNADFSLGYSITNIGKKVWYVEPTQADPIPRTARLGYSFGFGLDLSAYDLMLNTFNYSFTVEAEDILIKGTPTGIEYQNLLGDIKFGKNLIGVKGDNNVIIHRGHIFRIFDTFILTSGRFNGMVYNNIKSGGFGFSSVGVFKLLNTAFDSQTFNYIADHLVLEYYRTNIFTGSSTETKFSGLALYLRSAMF